MPMILTPKFGTFDLAVSWMIWLRMEYYSSACCSCSAKVTNSSCSNVPQEHFDDVKFVDKNFCFFKKDFGFRVSIMENPFRGGTYSVL